MTKDDLIERLREALKGFAVCTGNCKSYYSEDHNCGYEIAEQALTLTADDDWQPIETAPRDGTRILATKKQDDGTWGKIAIVHWDNPNCSIGSWSVEYDWDGRELCYSCIDVWQPLPSPLKGGTQDETNI